MTFPTLQQAQRYLAEAEQMNPGAWVAHSRHTAEAAWRIASRWPGLDPQTAQVAGLLHDIGRREGVRGMVHVLDGYRFMLAEGYPGAARIALSHSFTDQNHIVGATFWDGTEAERLFVVDFVRSLKYDGYDRLIQLCDALCMAEGPVLMEKRLFDVTLRYGANEHTVGRWRSILQVKDEIEAMIGGSVYELLPEVIDNTFGIQEKHAQIFA